MKNGKRGKWFSLLEEIARMTGWLSLVMRAMASMKGGDTQVSNVNVSGDLVEINNEVYV